MICNSTPSSVCGPLKQLHIVVTMRSIKNRPGLDESGIFPVKWPYAINFCKQSSAVTTIRGVLLWHANSNGRKYFSALMTFDESFRGNGSAVDWLLSLSSMWPPSFNCFISPDLFKKRTNNHKQNKKLLSFGIYTKHRRFNAWIFVFWLVNKME